MTGPAEAPPPPPQGPPEAPPPPGAAVAPPVPASPQGPAEAPPLPASPQGPAEAPPVPAPAAAPLPLRSFKLHFVEGRARVVPARDAAGCAFAGPGVDLVGDDARAALALGAPLVAALVALEPGARVRSLSVDLEAPRLLASLEPSAPEADPRPRAVRLAEAHLVERVLAAAGPLLRHLGERAAEALSRRSGG